MIAADELIAVPGASDADRPAWLAQRRTGCTATEIRDMYLEQLGKPSYVKRDELIARKLGRIPEVADLSHVPVVAWGKLREPVIAEVVRQRYGIEPESRVFSLVENPGKLASPDGIGRDFDGAVLLSEIKTAGGNVDPGTELFDKKGYLYQCMWGMRVLGARRCLYVWEERIEVAPNVFEPGEQHFHWIDYDEVLAARLDDLADRFLDDLTAAASEPWERPEVDEVLDTHAVNYLRGLAAEKEGKALKEASYRALLAARKSQTSALARVTFTPGKPAVEFDEEVVDLEAAAAAHPKETAALGRAKARVEKLQAEWDALADGHRKTVHVVAKGTADRVTVTATKETKK